MLFAEKIKHLREDSGQLQRKIAAALDVDAGLYSKIERGERPAKREQVIELANIFHADEKGLTWSQAIEKAIIQLGYIATLKQIHQVAPTFKKFEGITPDKTINERVQRDSNFVKLRPGLYGLKNHLDKLPDEFNPQIEKTEEEENKITHSYVQGMLIEVGNLNGYQTFAPDKSYIIAN